MFGILWTKSGETPVLAMAGYDYPSLDCYLEDYRGFFFQKGWGPEIVKVHKERGRYVC